MRQCEELAELGMELARAAQREALRDLQPPIPGRQAAVPGLPAIPTQDRRQDIFGALFANIARNVRQTILLESRIAAGIDYLPRRPNQPQDDTPDDDTSDDETSCDEAPAPSATRDTPRLEHERLDDESAAHDGRPVPDILGGLHHQLREVMHSNRFPDFLRADQPPSDLPPHLAARLAGPPPPPLTTLERSALIYNLQHPDPKPRARPLGKSRPAKPP